MFFFPTQQPLTLGNSWVDFLVSPGKRLTTSIKLECLSIFKNNFEKALYESVEK